MKRTLLFACLLLPILFAVPALSAPAVKVGDPAPDFDLQDLAGKKVSLSAFRGKVVLLNFWGTFCPPCRAEMPSLNRVYLDLKDRGFVVIGLSVDRSDGPVRSLVAADGIEFPVALDAGKEVFYGKYATFALPLTFLIDKKGVIVEKFFGKEEWDSAEMKQKIAVLLDQT